MKENKIDIAHYHNSLSRKNQLVRLMWGIVWPLGTWFLPRSVGMPWKRLLLRMFGAHIASTANIRSTTRVYYPANLWMDEYSSLDENVNCYNVAPIRIGAQSTVSQGAFLCTASHDITNKKNPLITSPIVIESQAWVAADAFVGMGITIGEGAVVGARAAVFKDVEPWSVVGGNPAIVLKKREILK